MARRLRLATLTLGACAVAALAGCTGGHPAAGGTASPAPSVTGSGGLTDEPPATATYPGSAETYARAAISAWSSHDTARLAQLNDPADTVFSTLDSGDYNRNFATLYMCDGAAGSTYCTFYNTVGDALRLRLRNDLLGHPHAVIEGVLTSITFPADYRAYAQEALTDWQAHNSAAVGLLTGKPGDTAFSGVPAGARTQEWTFSHNEGAAGHQYYVWLNSAGDSLAFGFANPGIVSPPANRHGLIEAVVFTPHS